MLNHFSIVGVILALLLFAVAAIRKSDEFAKGILALFIGLALVSIAVYLTGESAEEQVKRLPWASPDLIETHDDVAAFALALVELLGGASLVGLFLFRRSRLPQWFIVVILILSIASSAAMVYTGYLGGKIRHSELPELERGS
jgi:uncharacterized membrane protein